MTSKPEPDFRRFILENTSIISPPHVPDVKLHIADDAHALWHRTEEELQQYGLQPPFWAFAWAGGQGLARHIFDHPEMVRGKHVLDFASGSGLVAIAAAKCGAASVLAADIDPFCSASIAVNSALNQVVVEFTAINLVGKSITQDILLAGDVFYDRQMAKALIPWFSNLTVQGKTIVIGDPARAYLPRERLIMLSEHHVQVTLTLEDADVRKTTVWQFTG
jgi:predicted nicotinamide N-methyase